MAQASTRAAVAIAAMGIAAIAGCSSTRRPRRARPRRPQLHLPGDRGVTYHHGAHHHGAHRHGAHRHGAHHHGAHHRAHDRADHTAVVPALPPRRGPDAGPARRHFAHGQGFGQVKPAKIFNGGDPTGLVTHVTWSSWGGAQAQATGTSEYVGPNQSVATGRPETATVVAFDLGNCDGKLMYQAVEWYFPQHGQSFNPRHYENICTGSYVPSQ